MANRLSPVEARVIGCLLEKQITTPEQYPLSLNALINACNQKSNRDPVANLDEAAVQRALEDLTRRHLVMEKSGFGSRVPKYQHRFCNTEHGSLNLSAQELAILCELLLRGPQTPGELRSRAARMAPFADAAATEQVLERLATRADGPFVVRLAREPGRREARYAGCFGDTATADGTGSASQATEAAAADDGEAQDQLSALERRLEELEARIAQLEAAQLQTPRRD